jgi:hypothetical protein
VQTAEGVATRREVEVLVSHPLYQVGLQEQCMLETTALMVKGEAIAEEEGEGPEVPAVGLMVGQGFL